MLKMTKSRWCSVGQLLIAILLLSACTGHKGLTVMQNGQLPLQIDSTNGSLLPDGLLNYKVVVGDRLSFEAMFESTPGEHFVLDLGDEIAVSFNFGRAEYKVMAGDTLRVNFLTEPDMDFDVVVRPDGRITIPGIGELKAFGKTPRSVAAEVSASYHQFKEVPPCTVTLVQPDLSAIQAMGGEFAVLPDGNVYIPILGRFHAAGLSPDRFAQLLTLTASDHFSGHIESTVVPSKDTGKQDVIFRKEVEVGPLGSVILPRIGEIQAAGRDLADLRAEVMSRLGALFSRPLQVTQFFMESSNRVVYVSGQVERPGSYPVTTGLTTLQAIMQAGGVTDEGSLGEVVVVHRGSDSSLIVYRTNLNQTIEEGITLNDLRLTAQDVIFVPKTGVAQSNQFIDQFITKMLPFSRNVNYNFNAFDF